MLNNVLFTGGEFLKENIETGEIVYQRGNDKNRRTWTERRDKVHIDWNDCRSELMSKFLHDQSFSSTVCSYCNENHLDSYYVKCSTCRMKMCDQCDHKMHQQQPFHRQFFQNIDTLVSLLPTEFLDNGEVVIRSTF